MPISTDTNDPNFGLETDDTSPNFGLPAEPKSESGIVSSVISEAKGLGKQALGALNPIHLIQGVLDIQPRSGLQEVLRTGRMLRDIVGGAGIEETVRKEAPEVAQQQEAILGKYGPEAQRETLSGIGTQLGMVAAPFIHGKILPIREMKLGEVTGHAPTAPEVSPVEMPAVEPVTDRQLAVVPETRFQMVDEPTPEIAPARPIYETIRYQPTERPGQEAPLSQEAFPSISRSAEEARRTARTVETGIESETARIGGEPSATQERQIPESSQPEYTGDGESRPPAEAGGGGGPQPSAEVVPQERQVAEPTVPQPEQVVQTPAETQAIKEGDNVGIAAKYREDELGPGSVIPGIGKTADEARAWGHDFVNKGGNPYDVVNNKGPKRELWQDVGVVRAEYERLGIEKRNAEAQLEANPNDPQAQMAFDNADLAQRQWSKDAQPVLTRAGDALRAASRSYPKEINTFSDFTDIVNDHFGGEVELTPDKRSELQKAVKAIKKGNLDATQARAQVTDAVVKKANGKVMDFDSLKTDLRGTMEQLLKDCVL